MLDIQKAHKSTLGQRIPVLISPTLLTVLEAKRDIGSHPKEIIVPNIVNPVSFLSRPHGESVLRDCFETTEAARCCRSVGPEG